MKFEVIHGMGEDSYYEIVEAGTVFHACMLAMEQHLEESDVLPYDPFCVTNLETGKTRRIKLTTILNFRILAAENISPEETQRLERQNEEYRVQEEQRRQMFH